MRTGRTLTVFRKLETPPRKFGAGTPPKIWSRHPPKNLEQAPPPKIWSRHPPENLEQALPPRKFGSGTPPRKIGSGTPPENLEQAPPRKFGAGTSPRGQTHVCENITLAKTSFRPVKMVMQGPLSNCHENCMKMKIGTGASKILLCTSATVMSVQWIKTIVLTETSMPQNLV